MGFRTKEIKMKCPFCEKSEITITHIPISLKFKKGPYGGGKSGISRTAEKNIVHEDRCPFCGKTKKEIQKALETGISKELTHEERLKRLREAGMPTRIETKQ